jgi:hypothetical protein
MIKKIMTIVWTAKSKLQDGATQPFNMHTMLWVLIIQGCIILSKGMLNRNSERTSEVVSQLPGACHKPH